MYRSADLDRTGRIEICEFKKVMAKIGLGPQELGEENMGILFGMADKVCTECVMACKVCARTRWRVRSCASTHAHEKDGFGAERAGEGTVILYAVCAILCKLREWGGVGWGRHTCIHMLSLILHFV